MPNEMYNEYQSLAGNTDPAAMQRRRELARALQMQRRGTIPPGSVTAADIAQKQRGMAQPQMTPPVPVQPPAFAGNRMGQPNEAAIQGFNPAQNYAGNRMGQPNEAAISGFNPESSIRINQILSRFPRR